MEILFIFTPKLVWQGAQQQQKQQLTEKEEEESDNTPLNDHLITIVNASTLLSSVIRVILSKFKKNETTVMETLVAVNRLTDMIQRMKFLVKHEPFEKINYRVRNFLV